MKSDAIFLLVSLCVWDFQLECGYCFPAAVHSSKDVESSHLSASRHASTSAEGVIDRVLSVSGTLDVHVALLRYHGFAFSELPEILRTVPLPRTQSTTVASIVYMLPFPGKTLVIGVCTSPAVRGSAFVICFRVCLVEHGFWSRLIRVIE